MKSVDIAIPVYYGNIPQIEESINKQSEFYKKNLTNYKWKIIISINGPDKGIIDFSKNMMKKYDNVGYTYTKTQGKGAGIKTCWSQSDADILAYMDVDLSTGIDKFPDLINAVDKENDLSLGSKYLPESIIARGVKKRDYISKVYHTLFTKTFLGIKTSDVHCGFKAITSDAFKRIYPFLKDNIWFFDTELMFWATRKKLRIKEIPIIWTDSGVKSGVKIYRTIIKFVFKIIRLRLKSLIWK